MGLQSSLWHFTWVLNYYSMLAITLYNALFVVTVFAWFLSYMLVPFTIDSSSASFDEAVKKKKSIGEMLSIFVNEYLHTSTFHGTTEWTQHVGNRSFGIKCVYFCILFHYPFSCVGHVWALSELKASYGAACHVCSRSETCWNFNYLSLSTICSPAQLSGSCWLV